MTATEARVAETHSAWVVLLGDRAYKVKKPVKLAFLDFSTLASRRAVARREVDLNRRLAPDVYLGVAELVGAEGEPGEPVIVMRRMPDDRRLSTLVAQGAPIDDEIRAVARAVAAFHANAETSSDIAAAGAPDVIRARIKRDLSEIREYGDALLDPSLIAEAARLVDHYLRGRARLLEQRVAAGLVRDGHGDLLAGDVFCLPDGPRILDCIEFDDQLRYGDVLADVAFLAMDLEYLGAPALATRFVAEYQEFSAEHHPQTLIHYYVAFRALVRSKVACIRAGQGDDDSRRAAPALLDLAVDHLRRGHMRMVLVGGLPGTGKSTVAAGLAERLGWSLIRTDEVRKDVTGRSHRMGPGDRYGEGIYTPAATAATYEALLARARTALELGEPVVLDASWSREQWRADATRCARETSSAAIELRCDAPFDVAADRLAARRAEGADVSDATPEVASLMRTDFDEWPGAHSIATTASVEESLAEALRALGADRG